MAARPAAIGDSSASLTSDTAASETVVQDEVSDDDVSDNDSDGEPDEVSIMRSMGLPTHFAEPKESQPRPAKPMQSRKRKRFSATPQKHPRIDRWDNPSVVLTVDTLGEQSEQQHMDDDSEEAKSEERITEIHSYQQHQPREPEPASLYPPRFTSHLARDGSDEEEDDDDDAGSVMSNEEVLEDFGLLQAEVLAGEDRTHMEPVSPSFTFNGLPAPQAKRVTFDESAEDAVPFQRAEHYPPQPKKAEPEEEEACPMPPLAFPSFIGAMDSKDEHSNYNTDAAAHHSPELHDYEEEEEETIEGIDLTNTGRVAEFDAPRLNKRIKFDDDTDIATALNVQPSTRSLVSLTQSLSSTDHTTDNDTNKDSSDHDSDSDDVIELPRSTEYLTDEVEAAAAAAGANVRHWMQRYRLFSRFDDGVQLDSTAWFSTTPEPIAAHHARRIALSFTEPVTVIDAFAGVGGNAIAFASHPNVRRVVAIELNEARLSMARHNAEIYGVHTKIEFMHGDCLALLPSLSGDVAFLAPPWLSNDDESDDYTKGVYELSSVAVPGGGAGLIEAFRQRFANIAINLPRNVDVGGIMRLTGANNERVEIESNRCNEIVKTVTAYFGSLVRSA